MFRNRVAVGTMVMAAAMFAGQAVYAATPLSNPIPMHNAVGKTKLVSLNLRNDSKAPIKVKVGENEVTLEPGKLTAVKAAVGDKIVAEAAGPDYVAGDVLQVISEGLKDSTVVLR